MRELVCNGQLWARAAVRQLRSHNVEQLEYLAHDVEQREYLTSRYEYIWENPGNYCCYSIYFDISTIVWSSRFYNKSLMAILGLAGVLFCKMSRHGQSELSFVPKKMLTWVTREARGGLKAAADERQQPYYYFSHAVFCYFLFLSGRVLFSLPDYSSKPFQHIDIVGLSQAEL